MSPAAENPAAENPAAENPAAENPAAENPAAVSPAAETPLAGRDEVEDLRRVDVRAATRIVFVCADGRTRSVAAATMARAMAPRDLQAIAVAVTPRPMEPDVVESLSEIGLSHPVHPEPLSAFVFAAGDIVVTFDDVTIDAGPALSVVAMTVGDSLDVGATLGQLPRGPALSPGDVDDTRTRIRFAFGLIRERTQALLSWTERDPTDEDD